MRRLKAMSHHRLYGWGGPVVGRPILSGRGGGRFLGRDRRDAEIVMTGARLADRETVESPDGCGSLEG